MSNSKLESIWTMLKDNKFEFDGEINKDLLCTICKNILIKGSIAQCGCKYCWGCITNYLCKEEKFCPGDMNDCKMELLNMDTNVHLDLSTNIKISKLTVKCPEKSCEFKDDLKRMEDHIRVCNVRPLDCPFLKVGCQEAKLSNDQVLEHLQSENESHIKLLMACLDSLKNEIESLKNDVLELKQENSDLVETIKAEKGIQQRTNIELHRIIKEQNREIGDLQGNVVAFRNIHRSTQNVMEALHSTKHSLQNLEPRQIQKQKQMDESIALLRKENEALKSELNILKMEEEENKAELLKLHEKTKDQARELEQWKEKYQFAESSYSSLAKRWQQSDETIKFLESKTTSILSKVNDIESNMYKQNCGEFVWCIDKFADKTQTARNGINQCLYSDPFYTHKNGYKMCLRVDPDGFGSGKSTHLSIYFCLMRGAFDNILQWPFKFDVTLSVINQQTGLTHMSDTAKFENFPNPVNWNKPATDRNGGIGYHQFIKLEELLTNSTLCSNDQIFIKCSVKMGKQ